MKFFTEKKFKLKTLGTLQQNSLFVRLSALSLFVRIFVHF